jgi:hypothetical protein
MMSGLGVSTRLDTTSYRRSYIRSVAESALIANMRSGEYAKSPFKAADDAVTAAVQLFKALEELDYDNL